MHLKGSCHCGKVKFAVESAEPVPFMRCYCSICRKTAGAGGYAINLGADARTMKVTGKRYLGIYRARLPDKGRTGARLSSCGDTSVLTAEARCGYGIRRGPNSCIPHAGAIDTPLPVPPENVHCLVGSKAPWVKVEGNPEDPRFKNYPDMSLAQWHRSKGLTSPEKVARSRAR